MHKHKRIRRIAGIALMVCGGWLMWFAPETGLGVFLLAAGISLELAGIRLEHKQRD